MVAISLSKITDHIPFIAHSQASTSENEKPKKFFTPVTENNKLLKEEAPIKKSLEKLQGRIEKLNMQKEAFTLDKASNEFTSNQRKKRTLSAVKTVLFALSLLGTAISFAGLALYLVGFIVSSGTTFGSAPLVALLGSVISSPLSIGLVFLLDTAGFIPQGISLVRTIGSIMGIVAKKNIVKAKSPEELQEKIHAKFQEKIDLIEKQKTVLSDKLHKVQEALCKNTPSPNYLTPPAG